MIEGDVAHSFDCDGVLVWRIPVQSDVLPWNDRRVILPSELPVLDRTIEETGLRKRDIPTHRFHSVRWVTNRAVRAVRSIFQGDIYLNTGRKNRRAYVDSTEQALVKAGIRDRFKDLYFGVKGVSNIMSKLALLNMLSKQYDTVYHYDDNPKTSLTVEQFFREQRGRNNVRSIIVSDWSTSFLTRKIDLVKHPNLVIARNIEEAVKLAQR